MHIQGCMTMKCDLILDLLQAAFTGAVTEQDYHSTVQCLREYAAERDCREAESRAALSRGWPADYDPCEHMERIRVAMTFGSTLLQRNEGVAAALSAWRERERLVAGMACA